MSRKALVDTIEGQFRSRAEAERAVDTVTAGIVQVVRGGELVVLKGFGTFRKKYVAERDARNPRTGETIRTAARDKLSFSGKVDL